MPETEIVISTSSDGVEIARDIQTVKIGTRSAAEASLLARTLRDAIHQYSLDHATIRT